jgi:ABC-2 type transport system permease protein
MFFANAYLSYVALFHWLQPATYLATKVLAPLGQILFFTFIGQYGSGQSDPTFYIIGNSVQLAGMSGIFGVTMSIGGDRGAGTLAYIFGTPSNRLLLFVGRSLIHILDGMVGVLIGLTWGVVLLGLDMSQTDPAALAVVILVTSFSTSGMGLMLGSLSLITVNVMFINNLVYFALLVFSGSNVVLQDLPAWMQAISNVIPLTRGIRSARAIIGGADLAQVAPWIWEEFLIGIIYVLVGYVLFRMFEIVAKRRGTLEVF